jgi:ribose transport system substrate-binding protein
MIASTRGNVVFNLFAPLLAEDLKRIVELCTTHQVYFVTHNNIPRTDLLPWSIARYYVAHIDLNERLAGLRAAQLLITAMGGRGGIAALGGKVSDGSSLRRFSGLQAALSSPNARNCYVLPPSIDAEWQASTSYEFMRSIIAEKGDQLGGVWAANDDMAIGAIEALRFCDHPVPVTGIDGTKQALDAIQSGSMIATAAQDPRWNGGIGLSLALNAKLGLLNPDAEPHSHRAFYGPFDMVTQDNVLQYIEYRDAEHPVINWTDFWSRSTGTILEG